MTPFSLISTAAGAFSGTANSTPGPASDNNGNGSIFGEVFKNATQVPPQTPPSHSPPAPAPAPAQNTSQAQTPSQGSPSSPGSPGSPASQQSQASSTPTPHTPAPGQTQTHNQTKKPAPAQAQGPSQTPVTAADRTQAEQRAAQALASAAGGNTGTPAGTDPADATATDSSDTPKKNAAPAAADPTGAAIAAALAMLANAHPGQQAPADATAPASADDGSTATTTATNAFGTADGKLVAGKGSERSMLDGASYGTLATKAALAQAKLADTGAEDSLAADLTRDRADASGTATQNAQGTLSVAAQTAAATQGIAAATAPATAAGAGAAAIANPAAAAMQLLPQVGSNEWGDSLSQKVIFLSNAHQQSAELHLNPPDLGPLQIVLQVADSHAHALFVSAHPQVREAVEAALPNLRQQMSANGLSLGNATVSDGSHQAASGQGDGGGRRRSSGASGGRSGGEVVGVSAGSGIQGRRVGLVDTFA